jgi:hypothetical protein
LFLQNAQHFGLGLDAHVADLVEKDRAAVGNLEFSAAVGNRSGKRAADVAKELALDQFLRNRRTVHLDERGVAPPAERVNGPCDQFLPGAVFAVNQHAAVGRRRHRAVLAVLPQCAIFVLQAALAQRIAHNQHGFLEREWLLDEIERAEFDRPHRRLDVAVPRNQHDLRINLPLAQPGERGQAVHAGQPDVQHDQIDGASRHAFEASFAARHRLDAVALVAQHAAQRTAHAWFVVDDEDRWLHRSVAGLVAARLGDSWKIRVTLAARL